MAKRVLLLGGSSFVGAAIRRHPGWSPGIAWTYRSEPQTGRSAGDRGGVRLDLLHAAGVEDVVGALAPTHIIDAALPGREDPVLAERGIRNVRQALGDAARRVRYVLVSSDAVFSGDESQPYAEDDPVTPGSRYGEAKVVAERAVLDGFENASVARTCLVYGVDARTGREPLDARTAAILARLSQGAPVGQYATQYRTPTPVDDLAAALLTLLGTAHRGILHLAGPTRCSRAAYARHVARAFGLDPELVHDQPLPEHPEFGRDTSLDSSLARRLLGWSPLPLEQSLHALASARRDLRRGAGAR